MSAGVLEDLVHVLPLAGLLLDGQGVILAFNDSALRLFGGGPERFLGRSFHAEFGTLPGLDEIERRLRGGVDSLAPAFGLTTQTRDGTGEPVELRVHFGGLSGAGRERWLVLFESLHGDGEWRRQLDRSHDVLGQLRVLQHEISNQMMGLLGQVELLADQPGLSETARAKLELILGQCRRIRDCLREMKQLSRLS